jgi:hypothetical protein
LDLRGTRIKKNEMGGACGIHIGFGWVRDQFKNLGVVGGGVVILNGSSRSKVEGASRIDLTQEQGHGIEPSGCIKCVEVLE